MEALVALGLAGNVVQFVQFSGTLISETMNIKKTGYPSSLPDLRKLAEDLINHTSEIVKQLEASGAIQPLLREDQNLLDIASESHTAGCEFLAYLDSLIQEPSSPLTPSQLSSGSSSSPTPSELRSGPSRVLYSAKISLKYRWAHHKIEKFAGRLDKLRGALVLSTILALQASTRGYNRDILVALKSLQSENRGLQRIADMQSESTSSLSKIHGEVQQCLSQMRMLRQELPDAHEKAILQWLYFRQISWRYEEISHAHRDTFEWIFVEPMVDHSWDSYHDYLISDTVKYPYFINGKAGSGKSTLMKFLVDNVRTQHALKKWAGTSHLGIVKIFFWNLGTDLQKSHVGMLRSLLYTILRRHPELLPAVFPDEYHNQKDLNSNVEPSYVELKRWVGILLEKSSSFLKLGIFIDGIDEFEGDHRDFAVLLLSFLSDSVKLIVSSRPIPSCVHAFSECPGLRLQELTKRDMETYVMDHLVKHPSMVQLVNRFPRQAGDLIQGMGAKAEGVFLWVRIVVGLLLRGLEAGDDIEDLQRRLDALPPDLRDLYRRMMGKMQPDYQIQASQIFQIFHAWNTLVADWPLRTQVLFFALRPLAENLERRAGPLDAETCRWHYETMENKLRSRCCGLLEICKDAPTNSRTPTTIFDQMRGSRINYLHRTVAEFLTIDDVWRDICSSTDGIKFHPIVCLVAGYLSMVKISTYTTKDKLSTDLSFTFRILRCLEDPSDALVEKIMQNIDNTMLSHVRRASFRIRDPSSSHAGTAYEVRNTDWQQGKIKSHWSSFIYPSSDFLLQQISQGEEEQRLFSFHHRLPQELAHRDFRPVPKVEFKEIQDIFTVAAREGITQYLQILYKSTSPIGSHLYKYALVAHALESWRPLSDIPLSDRQKTLTFLFRHVVDPMDSHLGFALRKYTMEAAEELFKSHLRGDSVDSFILLRTLLAMTHSPHIVVAEIPQYLLSLLISTKAMQDIEKLDELRIQEYNSAFWRLQLWERLQGVPRSERFSEVGKLEEEFHRSGVPRLEEAVTFEEWIPQSIEQKTISKEIFWASCLSISFVCIVYRWAIQKK